MNRYVINFTFKYLSTNESFNVIKIVSKYEVSSGKNFKIEING